MVGQFRPSKLKKDCRRKVAYFSMEEADQAAQKAHADGIGRDRERGGYLCTICHHYHWGHRKVGVDYERKK